MTDFPEDRMPDFCKACGLPMLKRQAWVLDAEGIKHKTCYDEDQKQND